MKKIVQFFTLLLFAFALLGGAPEARASHLLGGDMTYVSLGNNQYRVKFRLYRDCSGITPGASDFTLECRNGGCNVAASVSAPLVQQGAVESGNPFCTAVSSGPCQGPAGLPNYDIYNYLATVTLPPGNWTMSTNSSARPSLANAAGGTLYVEATLDNRNSTTGAAVANSSPQFDPQDIPIQYVCWKQPTTITFSAIATDGDSLVYSLAPPLQGCNQPVTYSTFPGSSTTPVTVILSTNPLCVYTQPAVPGGTYSATNPIQTGFDTVGTCPIKTGVRRPFTFNQQSRSITFTPGVYLPNQPAGSGLNKYQIAVLITEYRRINGVRRVIGTVRREANLIVTDCGGNTTPNPVVATPVTPNSNTGVINTTDTTQITVKTCNYSRVELNFTDPDNLRTPSANQTLNVILPPNINTDPNLLDSGDVGTFSLSGNGTTNPKGVFFFQPSPTTLGRVIRLSLRIEDSACPIKGVQNRVVVIKIEKGNYATAAATVGSPGIGNQTPASICQGGVLALQGNVVRPDSIRSVASNTTRLQTYSFQWTANVGGNGLPTVTNIQNIAVNPTVTTRYLLRIAPLQGFAQGLCGDTTSILVRVVNKPTATATASLPQVCAGAPVLLTGLAVRPPGLGSNLVDTYSYRWTGPGIPVAGTVGATLTVRPTTLGVNTYTVVANGAAPYGCDATTTVQVTVVPPPTVSATQSLPQVCAGAPVVLSAAAVRPPGAGSALQDTYTYTWSGPGVQLGASGSTFTVTPTALGVNTYTVVATGSSQFGCSNSSTVQVTVVPPPTVAVTTNNAFICPGGSANLAAAAANAAPGFSDTYTYTWSGTGVPAGTTGPALTVRPTATTTYTVSAVGNTSTGCAVTGTVTVQVPPALVANFATTDSLGTNGQRTDRPPVVFTFTNGTPINTSGPVATFTYSWTYQRIRDVANVAVTELTTTFGSGAFSPKLTLNVAGYYRIRLTANVNLGGTACASTVKERIVYVPDLQVPNVITPNGDGFNDLFKVSTAGTSSKLEIFNRWGRKVYEQTNYQNNWGGDSQPAGVYYYLLTSNNGAQTKGWLEIMR